MCYITGAIIEHDAGERHPAEWRRICRQLWSFVRAEHTPAGYSPWRHMALTLAHATAAWPRSGLVAGPARDRGRLARAARLPGDRQPASSGWSTGTRCTARCARASVQQPRAASPPGVHRRQHGDRQDGRAGPDHDALVHDDRPVRGRVADDADRRPAARARAGRRLPAGRGRVFPHATKRCTPSITCPTRPWTGRHRQAARLSPPAGPPPPPSHPRPDGAR